jgi:hypothetical protein
MTRVIYNSKIPKALSVFIDVSAITLYPFILYSKAEEEVAEDTKNHEMIHIYQQKELWILWFYVLYVYYWLKNKKEGQSNLYAYANIPFEVEAYTHQSDKDYLATRTSGSWKKYIGKKLLG